MPKFSVIIPLYNKEKYISETLQSVFNQQYSDFEIIVVNDGSTDNGLKEVFKIQHDKLIVFDNKNRGVSEARNFGMLQAKGDYFAFLDADDIWKNNHLLNLNQLINSFPNCGLYCCNYNFDFGNNTIVSTIFPTLPKEKNWKGIVPDFFLSSLRYRIALTSAIAIPKNTLNTIGLFDPAFSSGQDTDYWSRIALKYSVAFTKEISVTYNSTADNRISNTSPIQRNFMTFEKFLEDEKTNTSLKIFNDMYRAELAIKHKIFGDRITFDHYKSGIDYKNINWKKTLLLKLPISILKRLWLFKQWLKTKKIDSYI